MRNLLAKVPKAAQQMVATMVRTIFAQPDPDSVWAQHRRVVDQLEAAGFTDAANRLDEATVDLFEGPAHRGGVIRPPSRIIN